MWARGSDRSASWAGSDNAAVVTKSRLASKFDTMRGHPTSKILLRLRSFCWSETDWLKIRARVEGQSRSYDTAQSVHVRGVPSLREAPFCSAKYS